MRAAHTIAQTPRAAHQKAHTIRVHFRIRAAAAVGAGGGGRLSRVVILLFHSPVFGGARVSVRVRLLASILAVCSSVCPSVSSRQADLLSIALSVLRAPVMCLYLRARRCYWLSARLPLPCTAAAAAVFVVVVVARRRRRRRRHRRRRRRDRRRRSCSPQTRTHAHSTY